MQIFPAIDILGGKVVRLARGDYKAVTLYNDDPIDQAWQFKEQGAEWIHLVDLDGARLGAPTQQGLIGQIIRSTALKVEVGGGIRSMKSIEELASAGASRVVIGTKLATDPEFTCEATDVFGDLICAGVDAKDGLVAIEGWQDTTSISASDLVARLYEWGIRHLVYTDIARDGMQTGIDACVYSAIARHAGFAVTASGGIGTLEDIRILSELGDDIVEAAIVGRAIYEGAFTVAEALSLVSQATR